MIGCLFLFSGFISLFRIRNVLKQQARSKTDKLEKLMVRIIIFSILYIVPTVIVTMCNIYEYQNRQSWALNHNCQCSKPKFTFNNNQIQEDNSFIKIRPFSNESPLYIAFLIKYIMYLVIGITSGFWIYSSKSLDSWIRFYGRLFCFYCFGLCKPESKKRIVRDQFDGFDRQNSMGAQLMSNISFNQQMNQQQINQQLNQQLNQQQINQQMNQQFNNSQLLLTQNNNNQQHMSSSSQFTNNSNRAYKQLLNQHQQFNAHLGLKSLSSSNNGGSSSTSHHKLNLSHV